MEHGFLDSLGTYTTLTYNTPDGQNPASITVATAINDLGQIVGYYRDSNLNYHAFVYSGGAYTTIDDPQNGGRFAGAFATGINDASRIVGYYGDDNGEHGFIAAPNFLQAAACYRLGTLILTLRGEVPVEDLAIGDRLVTISGAARPIKWIGHRAYDGRFVAGNLAVLPIRVAAGALAQGVPARDLWLSPEHALYLDGALVPAGLLVNGATIRQEESVDRLEYFHIELEAHDVILAEGAPAETFVDCDNRFMFHNSAEFAKLYPDDLPAPWAFCAPRAEEGSTELAAIRAALSERAEALGRITRDPGKQTAHNRPTTSKPKAA